MNYMLDEIAQLNQNTRLVGIYAEQIQIYLPEGNREEVLTNVHKLINLLYEIENKILAED